MSQYALATCSNNIIGIIISEKPEEVTFSNGDTNMSWLGFTANHRSQHELWCSKSPTIIIQLTKEDVFDDKNQIDFVNILSKLFLYYDQNNNRSQLLNELTNLINSKLNKNESKVNIYQVDNWVGCDSSTSSIQEDIEDFSYCPKSALTASTILELWD